MYLCLSLDGATTLYLSTKTNVNIKTLYEYLLHRLYKFDFSIKPNIIDKESYFIPSGYDSLSLLKSFDIQNNLDQIYSERIGIQKTKVTQAEDEVQCEDSQQFFKKFWDVRSQTIKPKPIESTTSTSGKKKLISELSKGKIDIEMNSDPTVVKQNSVVKEETRQPAEEPKAVRETRTGTEKSSLEQLKKRLNDRKHK